MRSGASPPVPNAFSARISSTPEPAPAALVGERRVDEAVEQHGLAAVEQRPELLGDELRPRRGVQQRLGARIDVERRVGDELPDPLGQLDPAGLAQHGRAELRGPGPRSASSSRRRRGPRP